MRVLVTGGYGFIGSFIAEKFYAEGHDIYIIDNLSTGNKQNVTCKHRFYHVDVEDPTCEEIFQSKKFDVVIHLAAQVNVEVSMANPYLDSKSNVLGLINMLQLSQKYGVKKVVFASSAAVYGLNEELPLKEDSACNPLSPYGMSKWVGEHYCGKWMEEFGLDTLCLRFSNVYGPKQGTVGEGGVISIFINRVLQGEQLVVYGDGEQTRDFIYVEDVAEAIYRAVQSNLTGLYNLSTNTEISVNQFINDLRMLGGIKEVIYDEPKQGDIKHSRLDNTNIKRELDWVPLHTFQEGLEKTFQWFSLHPSETKQQSKKSVMPNWVKALGPSIPYLENICIFALAFLLKSSFQDALYMVDYQLFYIVVVSFLLGRNQAILSIALGSIWFVYSNVQNGRELISLFVDHNTLVHIGLYMFIGLSISYVLDKKDKVTLFTRIEADNLKKKYESLQSVYQETLKINDELQHQVLFNNDSLATVYNIMKGLDYLDPLKTYPAAISIVEKLMKSNAVALYMIEQSEEYLRVAAHSAGLQIEPSLLIAENECLLEIKQTKGIYVNKRLELHNPALIAPIIIEDKLKGVIYIYRSDFEFLTLAHQNALAVTTKLISSAIHSADQYQMAVNRASVNIIKYQKEDIYA